MKARKKTRAVAALGCALVALVACAPGCATVVDGTEQPVTIQTNVPGATVRVDGQVVTRRVVRLSRRHHHVVTAEKPGYVPAWILVDQTLSEKWMVVDGLMILAAGTGAIALAVDFDTGAIHDLEPSILTLNLVPGPELEPATR